MRGTERFMASRSWNNVPKEIKSAGTMILKHAFIRGYLFKLQSIIFKASSILIAFNFYRFSFKICFFKQILNSDLYQNMHCTYIAINVTILHVSPVSQPETGGEQHVLQHQQAFHCDPLLLAHGLYVNL